MGDRWLALDAQAWWQLCTWPSMPQDQEVKVIADCRKDVRWGALRALTCRVQQLSSGSTACHVQAGCTVLQDHAAHCRGASMGSATLLVGGSALVALSCCKPRAQASAAFRLLQKEGQPPASGLTASHTSIACVCEFEAVPLSGTSCMFASLRCSAGAIEMHDFCMWHCRFRDSPLVQGPPHVQFLASSPILSTTCERIGTL